RATGRCRLTFRTGEAGVGASALSPDGKLLATGGRDLAVRVWDLATGKAGRTPRGPPKDKDGKDGDGSAPAFSPDRKPRGAAAGDYDKTVIFWDAATGEEVRRVTQGGVAQLAFAPGGKALAAGGWDGTARLWDVASGRELRVFKPAPELGARDPGVVDTVAVS